VKKFLLSTAIVLGLAAPAFAQGINVVPQVGLNYANLRANTYSAAILKLVPAASSTDVFCINGSASKKIHVNEIVLYATGTGISVPVSLNHNLGLDTGTVAVPSTYGPVPNPLNSNNPAATATTVAYNTTGGVPTIGGTVTNIRQGVLVVSLATTPVVSQYIDWKFGTSEDAYNQRLDIPSGATTEQYCLNLNATSPGGTLNGYMEWTEE
jgi:hypothetical protein